MYAVQFEQMRDLLVVQMKRPGRFGMNPCGGFWAVFAERVA